MVGLEFGFHVIKVVDAQTSEAFRGLRNVWGLVMTDYRCGGVGEI